MPRRHHWTQQVGSGRRQARGSRGARHRLSGDHPVVGGAVRSECGISPPRYASDASSAEAQQPRCVTWRSGMDGTRRHPSQEPAVHRPSFPAAAVTLAMRRWAPVRGDPNSVVRSVVRENVPNESRKMIRAASRYLHAHIACQQNPCARARKSHVVVVAMLIVLRVCRACGGVVVCRASRRRCAELRAGGAQRVTALRVHLPPRCRRAAGGSIVQPRCGSGTTGRCSTPV